MALNRTIKSLEEVPEAARGAYIKQGDVYVLDFEVEDVSGLKANHERLLQQHATAKQKLAALEGIDVDEYKTLKEQAAARAQAEAEKKGEWEKLRASLVEAHQKELDKMRGSLKAREDAISKLVKTNGAIVALKELGGEVELLLPHVERQVQVVEKDGQFVAQVMGPDGQPRVLNGKGDPFTIKDLVAEMRESATFKNAFSGHRGEGTGTAQDRPSTKGTASGTVSRTDASAFLANLEAIADGKVTVQ